MAPLSFPIRFRKIAGDRCLPTKKTRELLKQETKPCKGHEQDSGFDKDPKKGSGGSRHKVSISLLPFAGAVV